MTTMRIHCPLHVGDPTHHVALDVQLPLSLDIVPALMRLFACCVCGAEMVIATDAARTETEGR